MSPAEPVRSAAVPSGGGSGPTRPELIVHRGANSADALLDVPAAAHCVEIDVHRRRSGRLEVRHAKRLWGTRRLWEKWYLLPPDAPVPELGELLPLVAQRPGLTLWVDCKGVVARMADDVTALLEAAGIDGATLSSKSWWVLARAASRPGPRPRLVRSVGNKAELAVLRRLPSAVPLDGVVVHRRLLTAELVADLQRRYRWVFTWSVPDRATADRLLGWGVDGLIIDDTALLAALDPTGAPAVGVPEVDDGGPGREFGDPPG
ncbi:MAG: glycerophosphodiester phosphodiesterase [Acidimicrobiia bacterium]|nr:glycerophosphodiester phosphodiesterase [Acidimicrobiia bacterium]MDH4364636.1 glycerophosphodiester phosphodiesterase [Acidimicrobiia bacterium]